jgi:cyclophilin family peptidyl-prolyl cis-trans isomerase
MTFDFRRLSAILLLAGSILPAAPDKQPKRTVRLKPGLYAVFDTSEGRIVAQLYEKYTPIAVKNFVGLAQGTKPWKDAKGDWVRRPMYTNITFHRVIREEMIQTGDPTGTGAGNCGITIPDEFLPGLQFNGPGRLAVANTGKPDSGACQFFITEQAVPRWNSNYTIFGQVVEGQDVVHTIDFKPLIGDKPATPVILKSVFIERISGQ